MTLPATRAVLPPLLRIPLAVAGTVLVLAAARTLRRRRTSTAPEDELRGGVLGRAILAAAAIAARLPGLRRHRGEDALATRLAVAPHAWPSRWISAGIRAGAAAAARSSEAPRPPDLPGLAAGARLLAAILAVGPIAVVCAVALGHRAAILAVLLLTVLATRLPDMALVTVSRRAVRSAEHDAAAAVDLLAATASAGLSLPEAMVRTAGHAPAPLAAVLRAAAVRRAMGEEPGVALTAEAVRYGLPLLADVAQAMERQRRLGVPLGPELTRIAAGMRAQQRADALRRAARRGPLGTLVVALVIAPTCLAALIACLVGGLLQGGALPLR